MARSIDKVAWLNFNNLTVAAYPFYLFHVPGGYRFAAEPCSPFFPEFNLAAAYLFILLFFDVFILYILQKSLIYYFAQQIRNAGRNRKRVLVVGTGKRAEQFLAVVKNNFSWGLDVVGLLTNDFDNVDKEIKGVRV